MMSFTPLRQIAPYWRQFRAEEVGSRHKITARSGLCIQPGKPRMGIIIIFIIITATTILCLVAVITVGVIVVLVIRVHVNYAITFIIK